MVERLLDWFATKLGPYNVPSESSIKQRLMRVWPTIKPDVGRPSALTLVNDPTGRRTAERTPIERLEAPGEQLDGGNITIRRIRHDAKPVAGIRLIGEHQGVEHTVTVLHDGYEWEGRPYKSLSAIAGAITGTTWNGLVFFGIRNNRGRA